jgi:hypothetical protein
MRLNHHGRAVTLIAIGAAVLVALLVPVLALAHGPRIPSPPKAKSTVEMKSALAGEFGKQFTHSTGKNVNCNQRISRTIVKCAIEFHYHQVTWSGHGRIWRGICNGNNGISDNHHHTCWFVNWRLKRFDERCRAEGHSVAYCTEPAILH